MNWWFRQLGVSWWLWRCSEATDIAMLLGNPSSCGTFKGVTIELKTGCQVMSHCIQQLGCWLFHGYLMVIWWLIDGELMQRLDVWDVQRLRNKEDECMYIWCMFWNINLYSRAGVIRCLSVRVVGDFQESPQSHVMVDDVCSLFLECH